MPQPYAVPRFCEEANGTPQEWNEMKPLHWNKKRVSKLPVFAPITNASVSESFAKVDAFLSMRQDKDGRSIRGKLGTHTEVGGTPNWYKLPWVQFQEAGGEASLPIQTQGTYGQNGQSDWQRVWRGREHCGNAWLRGV